MSLLKKSPPEASSEGTAQVKKSEMSGITLGKIQLVNLLLVSMFILFAAYFSFLQYASQAERRQQAELQANLNLVAKELQGRVRSLHELLRHWSADPTIRETLLAATATGITPPQPLLNELKRALPALTRLVVIHPRQQREDPHQSPPLGFACIDLTNAVGHDHPSAPLELHTQGRSDEHFDLAIALGESPYRLLVTLDKGWLTQDLPSLPTAAPVLLQIHQTIDGQSTLIFERGDRTVLLQGLTAESTLEQSRFNLTLTQRREQLTSSLERQIFLAVFGAVVLLIWVVGLFISQILHRLLSQDLEVLKQQVRSVGLSMQHQEFPLTLVDLRQFSNSIKEALQRRVLTAETSNLITTERTAELDAAPQPSSEGKKSKSPDFGREESPVKDELDL